MRKLKYGMAGLVLLLAAAQFVQPERANPPFEPAASFAAVAGAPREVSAALDRGCRDCHSHQTEWPWYSKVSPASWLVAKDVREGRAHLNFSTWNIYGPEMSRLRLTAICDELKAGKMPPAQYTLIHPGARLTARETGAVCAAAR
jgi:hypothetical protein